MYEAAGTPPSLDVLDLEPERHEPRCPKCNGSLKNGNTFIFLDSQVVLCPSCTSGALEDIAKGHW